METRDIERLTCTLKSLLLRPQDFAWEIRQHPEMGRGCFATRDIPAGENLAYDAPLLYWEEDEPIDSVVSRAIIEACQGQIHTNVVNYLTAYAGASKETKLRIDDFALAEPEDAHHIAHMTSIWTRIAEQIWTRTELHEALVSKEKIVQILTQSHLNAHNFYTGHVMLEIGSKFNHACSPNSSYNKFVDAQGRQLMRIFTIKAVKKGEQLLSTYIGGTDMLKSTRERRVQLMANKAFYCRCSRCIEPEDLAPLFCPSCRGPCLRHDQLEWPWHCAKCNRRWWDAEITQRESQLRRLLLNVDQQMDAGNFPPVQIMHFLLRDTLEDLGSGHYLSIRARLLLDELYAFREVTGILESEEVAGRIANAWVYVNFLMDFVWKISPVVATNLAILRLRTLVGHSGHFPVGVPQHHLAKILSKAEVFLGSFWGEEDEDAALFRLALRNEKQCQTCKQNWKQLVVCGTCASAHYCSRECLESSRDEHEKDCHLAIEVGTIINSKLAF